MFNSIPFDGKFFLRDLVEIGQEVINKYHKQDALKNKLRNKLFSKELNKKMGFTNTKAKFEYYDISIISSNVVLNRHMDVSD